MKALVKSKPERGIWMMEQPMPEMGVDDVLIKIKKNRHLRHRYPYLQLG
ncbi:MAG: hypothetical protein Q9M45_12555 [Robiginitomaculum sp.]|nr:hypothetical protein [Robiginitomaculum sp.]